MVKIIKSYNNTEGLEEEINNFISNHPDSKLKDVKCLCREQNARQVIYVAIIEY